jgi:nucleoside-diphosphate-sugar epimerase
VGSELPITIYKFAEKFANQSTPPLPISIQQKSSHGAAPDHYVPNTTRAREELNFHQHIMLSAAIKKTIEWYRNKNTI